MKWRASNKPWSLAKRVDNWAGDTSAVGEPMPPGCTVACSADAQGRRFHLWCYAPGGEFHLVVPYSSLTIEGGPGTLPGGEVHTTGEPSVSYHGGMLKLFGKGWGGKVGEADYLYRVYTWITLEA